MPAWAYAVGLALAAVNYLAGSLRLRLLASTDGQALGFLPALRAYSLGLFSAAITPGSAGQAPAMVLSLVSDNLSARSAWVMAVRVWITDLIFLALTLPLSVLLLARATRLLPRYYPAAIAALLFLASMLMVWILIYRMRWLTAAAGQILKLPLLRRWRDPAVRFMGRLEQSGKGLWSAPLRTQMRVHLYTAVVYLSTYLTFYIVLTALRPGVPLFTTMAAAQAPMAASAFFPTPGGAGLLELVTASLVRGEHTAAAILAWRLLTYYLRMLIGPILGAHVLHSMHGLFGAGTRPPAE